MAIASALSSQLLRCLHGVGQPSDPVEESIKLHPAALPAHPSANQSHTLVLGPLRPHPHLPNL